MPNIDDYYLNLNLSYVNISIKESLLNTAIKSNFKISSSSNGLPILVKNSTYINNSENPEQECIEMFDKPINSDTIIILGLELGYGLKYAINNFDKHQIILVENDLELIKYVLKNVNLIEYLSKPNLKLITNISEFKELPKNNNIIANEYYKNKYKNIII